MHQRALLFCEHAPMIHSGIPTPLICISISSFLRPSGPLNLFGYKGSAEPPGRTRELHASAATCEHADPAILFDALSHMLMKGCSCSSCAIRGRPSADVEICVLQSSLDDQSALGTLHHPPSPEHHADGGQQDERGNKR
jgi:hypothetical protein